MSPTALLEGGRGWTWMDDSVWSISIPVNQTESYPATCDYAAITIGTKLPSSTATHWSAISSGRCTLHGLGSTSTSTGREVGVCVVTGDDFGLGGCGRFGGASFAAALLVGGAAGVEERS